MSENWRLAIDLREDGHARALIDRLEAVELKHDLASSFHDQVFLDRHGAEVRAYSADQLALSETLTKENIPNAHRWRYLVIGALDEDQGKQLAERVRNEAPEGTMTLVQGSRQATLADRPANPFAVFGGMAG